MSERRIFACDLCDEERDNADAFVCVLVSRSGAHRTIDKRAPSKANRHLCRPCIDALAVFLAEGGDKGEAQPDSGK